MNDFIEKYMTWRREYDAFKKTCWALLAAQDRLENR